MNKAEQLRASFTNFLGAMAMSTELSPRQTSHEIVAALTEESLRMALKDGTYDMFILKPLLRGTVLALDKRKSDVINALFEKECNDDAVANQLGKLLDNYRQGIEFLESIIEQCKEEN